MTTGSYVSDTVGRKSCSSCSIKQELIHPGTIWRRVESGVRLTRGIAVRKRANGTTGTFSYERGWYSASLTTSPRRESCQFRSDPRVRVPETPAPRSRPPSRRIPPVSARLDYAWIYEMLFYGYFLRAVRNSRATQSQTGSSSSKYERRVKTVSFELSTSIPKPRFLILGSSSSLKKL